MGDTNGAFSCYSLEDGEVSSNKAVEKSTGPWARERPAPELVEGIGINTFARPKEGTEARVSSVSVVG